MSKQTELEQIRGRIQYATERKAYLVEYIKDLAINGDLTAREIMDRATELVGLEAQLKEEIAKLDTLSLIIGYESKITKLEEDLKDATIDSFQNLDR